MELVTNNQQCTSNNMSNLTAKRRSVKETQKKMHSDENSQLAAWLNDVAEKRDKVAFSHLFKWFAPKIERIAARQYNNDALTLEIVQETLTNVWRKSHLYHPEKGAPTTWVYTIMRNVAFDLMRKMKNRPETPLSDDIWPIVEYSASEDDTFSDHLLDNKLLKNIDLLPQKQQDVVRGVYLLELSQEQLARQLDIPLGTVKSRLRLALAKLREQMGDDNHD